MRISYDKLLKLLVDYDMYRRDLVDFAGITTNACTQISREQSISMQAAMKICKAFRCDIGDIMEFKFDDESESNSAITFPGKMSDYFFQYSPKSEKMAIYKKIKEKPDGSFDLVLQTFVDPDDINPEMFPNDPNAAANARPKANTRPKKNE